MPSIEISVSTPARLALVDITSEIRRAVVGAEPGFNGLVSIFIPHTTAGVTINEGADPSVAHDIIEGLARLVPENAGYRHSEGNSDAHIKASLMGFQASVPAKNGRLRLGAWQAIYLAEFDGPRKRNVWITLIPEQQQG